MLVSNPLPRFLEIAEWLFNTEIFDGRIRVSMRVQDRRLPACVMYGMNYVKYELFKYFILKEDLNNY